MGLAHAACTKQSLGSLVSSSPGLGIPAALTFASVVGSHREPIPATQQHPWARDLWWVLWCLCCIVFLAGTAAGSPMQNLGLSRYYICFLSAVGNYVG